MLIYKDNLTYILYRGGEITKVELIRRLENWKNEGMID